jgi:hypothetical protein
MIFGDADRASRDALVAMSMTSSADASNINSFLKLHFDHMELTVNHFTA